MVVDSVITLDTAELTRKDWRKLFAKLTITDAEGIELVAYRYDQGDNSAVLPRGALDMVPDVEEVIDRRARPKLPKLAHIKQLDANGFSDQRAAVDAMFDYQQGQVRLSTGSGKTTIGCAFLAECGTRSLVLVHTGALLRQWVTRLEEEVPDCDVKVIQGQEFEIGHVTVATMQTMREKYLRAGEKFWRQFGCVIVDESHHAANNTYEWLLNVCPAYYRFGLSASDKRSDGRQLLVRFNVGPVIYRAPFKSQVAIEVQPVFSNFRSSINGTRYAKLVAELVRDEERNKLIARLTEQWTQDGECALVLSRQIKHLEMIAEQLSPEMDGKYAIVTGQLTGRKREELIQALRDGELRAILGTQIFEEGVDIPRLSRVMLAFPGTDVTTLQKVGRVSRSFKGKKLSIAIDIVDPHVAVFAKQYIQRKGWYKRSGLILRKIIDERRINDAKKKSKRGIFRVRRS